MNARRLGLSIAVVLVPLGAGTYACSSDEVDVPVPGIGYGRSTGSNPSSGPPVAPVSADGSVQWNDDAGAWPDTGVSVPAPPWSPDGGTGAPPAPTPEQGAAQCGACHATIYQEWRQAMHSGALVSPTVIAQTNEDVAGPYAHVQAPDPQKFCINCHSPTVAAISQGATLPQADSTNWRDGVTCTTCHQFNGESKIGAGGFASQFQQGFISGKTYLGNLTSPVGNRAHQSQDGVAFDNPNLLCMNCHEVWIDRDHDGIEEKGIDLVLQTTWNEYQDYKSFGGQETCVSCHMPAVPGLTRVADGASIPGDQYTQAPPRVVHDHSFVGPDHLLDNPAQAAAQAAQRQALLQKAVTLFIDRSSIGFGFGGLGLDVFIQNTGTGHDLPSGFAFARQMWLEVTVTDASGNVVDSSGLLANDTDDLCDGNTLADDFFNPMPAFFQGCRFIDGELTTFQQKLVSIVDVAAQDRFLHQDTITADVQDDFGSETWLQYLSAGVVARQRFDENGSLAQLLPYEIRDFHYDLRSPGSGGKVVVRALFRPLPPYFLRAIARNETMDTITPLISNLEIIEMARDEVDF